MTRDDVGSVSVTASAGDRLGGCRAAFSGSPAAGSVSHGAQAQHAWATVIMPGVMIGNLSSDPEPGRPAPGRGHAVPGRSCPGPGQD